MSYPEKSGGGLRGILWVTALALGASLFIGLVAMAVAGKFPL